MKHNVRWSFSTRIYDRSFRRSNPDYFSIKGDWMIPPSDEKEVIYTRTPRTRLLKPFLSEPRSLPGYKGALSHRVIGLALGITTERSRQLEASAFRRIRKHKKFLRFAA